MTDASETRLEGPWRFRIAMLMGAHVIGTINVVSVLAMAPVIQRALDLSATEVGLLMTAYYCGQAVWSLSAYCCWVLDFGPAGVDRPPGRNLV